MKRNPLVVLVLVGLGIVASWVLPALGQEPEVEPIILDDSPQEAELLNDASVPAPPVDSFPIVEHVQQRCPLDNPLRVVVHELPPMIMYEGGRLTGFDAELWDMVAQEIGCSYEPITAMSVPELIGMVERGEADVGIAGITITSDREERVDFSFPYYDAGLAVMVQQPESSVFLGLLKVLFDWEVVKVFLSYFGYLVTAGFLIWLLERHFYKKEREQGEIAYDFFPGFFQAVYFMNVTSTTVGYGDLNARSWPARVVTSFAMYGGFIFVGLVVGTIASIQINEGVLEYMRSAKDLAGHTVAVETGTTSEMAARRAGAKVIGVSKIEQGFDLLESGVVEAVVFDEPVLTHYTLGEGAGKVVVTGPPFTTERYGILTEPKSALTEQINRALLRIMGDGRYDTLDKKYFGH